MNTVTRLSREVPQRDSPRRKGEVEVAAGADELRSEIAQVHPSRRRIAPFQKEMELAAQRKAEAQARREAREKAEREREEKQVERERQRKAMAKARSGGKNGQRKLGRESQVLLEKVQRMMNG